MGEDAAWMNVALEEARTAGAAGEVPVGCVIVDSDGRELARGRNGRETLMDPTAHAEILAIRSASAHRGGWRLSGTTAYVTLEPCAMCAGAIYWTGIGRVVFALAETGLLEFTGSDAENPTLDLPCREVFARGQRRVAVVGPLLEDEAGMVHEGFWRRR